MAEERTYTEKELEEMANLLLADEEPAPEAKPKKKAAAKGKKEPAPEQPVKTPEERLNELLEKGKDIDALGHTYKNGKCTRCGEKQADVKTGDMSNMNLWFVVLTMSAAITVFAAAVLLRKKRSN